MTDAPSSLPERAVAVARSWVTDSARQRSSTPEARRLAALLADPEGLEFTIDFVDRVIRPEDPRVAASHLRRLARRTPAFLSLRQRWAIRWGARLSSMAPGFVVRRAQRTLRSLVGHLLADASPDALTTTLDRLRRTGHRPNVSLLGEAVLGQAEADRHRDAVIALIQRPDIDRISVKLSSITPRRPLWDLDRRAAEAADRLRPVLAAARAAQPVVLVTLDVEEYHDLDWTVEAFLRAAAGFPDLPVGIALQAYLPDAAAIYERLHAWAARRRTDGGEPITVRLVKGANVAAERVDAELHGWPVATWDSKVATDAAYKRLVLTALDPARLDAVRVGVASHNPFDLAWVWLLAQDRVVTDAVWAEMLLGMESAGPLPAATGTTGPVVLYTPVVAPDSFDSALAYLVRRLQENAAPDNVMSTIFDLADPEVFEREADRFLASFAVLDTLDLAARRTQDRRHEVTDAATEKTSFANTPDTDPALAGNRAWALEQLDRAAYTTLGTSTVAETRIHGPAGLETVVRQTHAAAGRWQARDAQVRSWLLHQAGHTLAHRRGDLVSIMAAEAGKTFDQADTEVSEAIDFAHYYAESLLRLEAIDGAAFVADTLTVVAPPWNFPVAIAAGSVLAALASGSAVLLKPAPQTPRCAAVVAEALWEAGIPRDVLRLVSMPDGPLSKALICHPDVDRVMLTGSWETAALFRSWRPDLDLRAETSGKNALVITPSADLDQAVADLVSSAFGHAGQKCSAASLGILVGSVGASERFRRQLLDATASLRVGAATDPQAQMGPLIEAPGEKLFDGLTRLDEGEHWLLEPQRLDETGRLWSPGIREGIQPGSAFHRTEYFGPVLGLMHAPDLDTAIAWQNDTDFGLTAGLHSLDPEEVRTWIDRVEAGNLYVNRATTGAIVQRQPFGGLKRSVVGPGAKAGGPNHLVQLGHWQPRPFLRGAPDVEPDIAVQALLQHCLSILNSADIDWLDAAARSDELAWRREYGRAKDVSRLRAERNVLRYLPTPVVARLEDAAPRDVVRLVLTATRVGAPLVVSTTMRLAIPGVEIHMEDHGTWLDRLDRTRPARVRLVSSSLRDAAQTIGGDPDVAFYDGPVTQSGRLELLPFLREQSVTLTHHRWGQPLSSDWSTLLPRRSP
ncbi:MAG: proline dehydrogenase family protein [Aeromicrobium sp.]|uniref:proline dehydrogenase family protein n=1 Tax=Aeromicrobium sp. TaxID=1871063 RepID=UPI0039E48AD2